MPKGAQWYKNEALLARFALEYAAVTDRFPNFQLAKDRHGNLYWHGQLTTNFGTRYRVKICYPSDYPSTPPLAYVTHPEPKDAPHMYGSGEPCLFHPEQGASHGFDPARTTAAAVIGWTAEWLACYEVYRRTGRWPGGKPQH